MRLELEHVFFEPGPPGLSRRRASSPMIAPAVERAVPHPPDPEPDPFFGWVLGRAGLDAQAYRASALERRRPACLRKLGVSTLAAAREKLEREPRLLAVAMDCLLLGVSGFFRDREVFEELRCRVLPELRRERRGLRVLSAGCAEGQELYSLAMLLEEGGALEESSLLGVDCRPEALPRAEAGRYEKRQLEGLGEDRIERHFRPEGDGFRVAARLRARARWRQADLLALEEAPAAFDLVLFRNVAIYMSEEAARKAWARFCALLAPGGVLMTGKAGRPSDDLPFDRLAPCLFRKGTP